MVRNLDGRSTELKLLIIGGTGAFSSRVTEHAVERGHEVAVLNRGLRPLPTQVQGIVVHFKCARASMRDQAENLRAFKPDVIIGCICFEPADAQEVVDLFPDIKRLIFVSTVDTYGEESSTVPIIETKKEMPVITYAKGKLACEQLLFLALGSRVTVFRPSHILGRGFLTNSLWNRNPHFLDRI